MVATPIGNLDDITMRALETLRKADLIACENPGHSLRLLNHFEIRKPLVGSHAGEGGRAARKVFEVLDAGGSVAYISDAGTPGFSDPGTGLAEEASLKGHTVAAIPGACAFACLVSAAGTRGRSFLFDGFCSPRPSKRRSRLRELLSRQETFVLYESPHRILALLKDIDALAPERHLVIGREMTKIHEEFAKGTAAELLVHFSASEPRGEFSVLVSG